MNYRYVGSGTKAEREIPKSRYNVSSMDDQAPSITEINEFRGFQKSQ